MGGTAIVYTKANVSPLIMLQVETMFCFFIEQSLIDLQYCASPNDVLEKRAFIVSTIRLEQIILFSLSQNYLCTQLISDSYQCLNFTMQVKVFRQNAVNRKPLKEFCSQNIESFLEKHAFVLRDHVIGPSGSTKDQSQGRHGHEKKKKRNTASHTLAPKKITMQTQSFKH